jgi:thiamine biosynthesis lipoprotein
LSKPLRVGLENPNNFKEVIGVVEIVNQSIAASSGSRRRWANFHHIINPHTLNSPSDILSTWVIARDGLIADAIATCLFLVSREKLEKYFEFESLVLYSDYSISKSEKFNAELFTKK